MPPSAAAAAGADGRPREGLRVGDHMVGGQTMPMTSGARSARESAASVTAASVSRPSGSSRKLDPDPDLRRLVGGEEARHGARHDDRTGEGRARRQPPQRPLERRLAAEHRSVLLGVVLTRQRPEPRPRASAEHDRDDRILAQHRVVEA